ncbi:MAG: cysteine desulfurase NifS [Clostridia bacterium]|nr:cysteine desulfurase NifS [Clostridia bacterium]
MNKYVYADNAATTRLAPEALEAMLPFLGEQYGNPSSVYSFADGPRRAMAAARETVASVIGAKPDEVVFTSGGTEADNHALAGAVRFGSKKHVITSAIEHHAVLHTLKKLKKEGVEVTVVGVNSDGIVDPAEIAAAIRPDTAIISVMAANNEVGSIQPIAEIGAIAREKGVLFHTDAVQAAGHIPLDVERMNIDLLSLSAHKFNGPRGVGALYIRRGSRVSTLIEGGGQEKNRRSGTENVAGIVGLAKALELSAADMESEGARLSTLRDRMIDEILKIPDSHLTGPKENRLPGLASFTFGGIEGESLVLRLDLAGIAASSGSACSTASLDPSHVLLALGLTHEVAHGSLRLSLGRYSTDADVDHILGTLPSTVKLLRAMSPVWTE